MAVESVTLAVSDSAAAWLILAKEKFEEAQEYLQKEPELLRVGDLNQPFQPYYYKYKARDTFQELQDKLTELLTNAQNTETRNDKLEKRFKSLQALFSYFLGVICSDTDEPSAGEDHFNKALHYLEKNDNLIETCLISINVKNNLGIIWSERGELDKARNYLCEAEQVYAVSKEILQDPPLSFVELFVYPILDRREKVDLDFGFGKAHVHSLYYLAQVYEKLGEAKLAASYCHKTLKWQIINKNYNNLEWSLNCATLSQFFVGRERFEIARYLLSCASFVFTTETTSEPEKLEEKELINHTKSDIARCWVNYCLALLSSSREKLSSEKQSIERNIEKMFESLTTDYDKDDYVLINQEQVDSLENEITFGYIETFDEARKVFFLGQKWIKESKIYYKLSERASDYTQIVQNNSTLYDHIAFFESSEERKCKMHKRRVDMLEETLHVLNQKYYLAICQQLMFELGEIYTTMVQLKLAQYDPKNPNPHSVKKINSLVDKGITTFQKLLASMNSPNGEHPEKYPDETVRPALLARFYIGQLYSKYIVIGDPAKRLANLQEIEKNYNFVRNYVTKNEEHESCISSELDVFKEMVELIPCRIQQELSSTLY